MKKITNQTTDSEDQKRFQTVVIGGGQAGLAAGYYLKLEGKDFIILDGNSRMGDSWRQRWDGLTLFTPSKFNSLPGFPFPKPADYLPSKDEVAEYLEGYAKEFDLPVRHNVKVLELSKNGQGYIIKTNLTMYTASNVIIATGPYQTPRIPAFANQLALNIQQIHTSAYRNPDQISGENVLVIGAGNSGAEISLELVQTGKKVWLAGRDVGRIPANGPLGKFLGGYPIWWFMRKVLSVNTPIGKKVKSQELGHGTPLGRTNRQEIKSSGVELTPRVTGVLDGLPQLENGTELPVESVIWATGFQPEYDWIHLPIFDQKGFPKQWKGVVKESPGLYFLGLPFQTSLSSSLLGGVGSDAAYITRLIGHSGVVA